MADEDSPPSRPPNVEWHTEKRGYNPDGDRSSPLDDRFEAFGYGLVAVLVISTVALGIALLEAGR